MCNVLLDEFAPTNQLFTVVLYAYSLLFQRASDYLSPHLKNTEDLLHLYVYWARLEAKLGKDVTAAQGVWENCLKIWFDNFYLIHFK